MDVPEPGISEEESILPNSLAELSEEIEPETRPYLISFLNYNDRLCQLEGSFDNKQRKNCLMLIKKIGTKVFSKSDIFKLEVTIKPVVNDGDYSDLYRGLDDGVQVEEAYLSNGYNEKGRMFFFTVDSQKIFYFIAFKNTHIDTSKSSIKH
jgi:hypothetical protein